MGGQFLPILCSVFVCRQTKHNHPCIFAVLAVLCHIRMADIQSAVYPQAEGKILEKTQEIIKGSSGMVRTKVEMVSLPPLLSPLTQPDPNSCPNLEGLCMYQIGVAMHFNDYKLSDRQFLDFLDKNDEITKSLYCHNLCTYRGKCILDYNNI